MLGKLRALRERERGALSALSGARFTDRITGDTLTLAEEISWQIQTKFLRRWAFIAGFTVLSFICWFGFGGRFQFAWNLGASWLAVAIESVVALALFGAMRRDQVVIRETLRGVKLLDDVTKAHQAADVKRDEMIAKLDELLALEMQGRAERTAKEGV